MIEALLELLILHAPGGAQVAINPLMITSLRPAGSLLTDAGECVISLADGKFITVRETCDQVFAKIHERK